MMKWCRNCGAPLDGSGCVGCYDFSEWRAKPDPDLQEAVCERQCADCPFPDRLCCECINSTFAKAKSYSGPGSVVFWRRINKTKDMVLYEKAVKLQEMENEIHAAIKDN